MRHLQPLLLLSLFAFTFWGCATDSAADEVPDVRLLCETQEEERGTPKIAVYTVIGQQKIKIAHIAACDSIQPGQYSIYGIPDSAVTAVGGQYEGTGDYLYVVREAGQLVYYQGWKDDTQGPEGFQYSRLGTYQNGDFELQLPLRREELVGTYTSSRETGSHILFVGMHGDTLIGEHFVMDGILPPPNQLNVLMTGMAPRDSAVLNLRGQRFHFASAMGEGTFLRSGKGLKVRLNIDGEQLHLQKVLSKDYSLPAE